MAFFSWANCYQAWGLMHVEPRRRIAKSRGNCGVETERLESRALLSATGRSRAQCPVAADVAVAVPKAANFAYPNVDGIWDVTGNAISGVATLVQKNNKVTATIVGPNGTFKLVDKFTAETPHELFDFVKVPNPITGKGKLKVDIHINFGTNSTPTSFTGEATVAALEITLPINGTRRSSSNT